MKKTKFNWKPGAIALVILSAFFIGSTIYVNNQKEFRIVHNPETKSEVGIDGRAPVGAAESYDVMASGALLWKLTKKNNKVWMIVAWVMLIGTAVYLALGANDKLPEKAGLTPALIMLAIALASWFAAYSSAYAADQTKRLTPAQYEQLKDKPEEMAKFFTDENYIR